MALSIKSQETERLARLVAKQTGETITGAIEQALKERLERLRRRKTESGRLERILEIANRVAALPQIDDRSDDEILGYDENGLPR
jgi:antitoxin VapB